MKLNKFPVASRAANSVPKNFQKEKLSKDNELNKETITLRWL